MEENVTSPYICPTCLNFEDFPQAVGPEEGQVLYHAIHRGKNLSEEILRKFKGTDLMPWAPADNSVLTQLVTAIYGFVLRPQHELTVHLAVPHDPYPGCDIADSITELWWHGLLAEKRRSMLKDLEFLRQPTRCVFSGSITPLAPPEEHRNLHIVNQGDLRANDNHPMAPDSFKLR